MISSRPMGCGSIAKPVLGHGDREQQQALALGRHVQVAREREVADEIGGEALRQRVPAGLVAEQLLGVEGRQEVDVEGPRHQGDVHLAIHAEIVEVREAPGHRGLGGGAAARPRGAARRSRWRSRRRG
jgi:hypothetical protein